MSKYKNRKITIDGITFDSKKEYNRYCELKLLERAGEISNLQRQVKFTLIPAQYYNGKCIRATSYIADFTYFDYGTNELVVEDVKGYKQGQAYALFTMKRKMMLYMHGIMVREI